MAAPTIPPPRRDSHAPYRFTPPARAGDAHCHVFGPANRFPSAPDRTYTPPVSWGTDWPHPNLAHMPDDGDLVDTLADLVPDEAGRNRILMDNPTVLCDFA